MSDRLTSHYADGQTTLPAVPTVARLSKRVHVALAMNPGPYYTLWLTSFVTFFHIERIPFVLRDGWTAGHRKKTVVQLITLYAFATLSIRIMIRDLPDWLQDWVQVAAACAALALASWTLRPGKGP